MTGMELWVCVAPKVTAVDAHRDSDASKEACPGIPRQCNASERWWPSLGLRPEGAGWQSDTRAQGFAREERGASEWDIMWER